MTDQSRPPVRVRVRNASSGSQGAPDPRLIADPLGPDRRKRLPNSGSMKKGETRNPNGRPRGAKGTKAMVRKVLTAKTAIREGGRTRKVTLYHALLMKELEMAIGGDWRARKTILELGRWALPEEVPVPVGGTETGLKEADEAIIKWFEDELRTHSDSKSGK